MNFRSLMDDGEGTAGMDPNVRAKIEAAARVGNLEPGLPGDILGLELLLIWLDGIKVGTKRTSDAISAHFDARAAIEKAGSE